MLFPINVDVAMKRWPWMNWAMMSAIFLCFSVQWTQPEVMERFVLGINGFPSGIFESKTLLEFMRSPEVDEHPLSWIGHMFLHADIFHLAGNLIFMWVFGNAVCAKLGNLLYPFFWLGSGLLAAVGERMISDGPMLGASGAIAGVMGFYMVFYLFNDVTMFYFVFRPGTFSVSSFWVVGSYVALDLFGALSKGGGVAYFAHLAGTAVGFATAIVLLKVGFLEADDDEHTLLDVIREKSQGKARRSAGFGRSAREAATVDPVILRQRLHVHTGGGNVREMLVAELLGRANHDPASDAMLVSPDGKAWSSFGDWRRKHVP